MAARKKTPEPTSEQTLRWISEKFVGPRRRKAIKELERLEQVHGRLVPKDIVEAARNPRSPLHGFFEWDDTVAAEKYRIVQATVLVRHVKVTITPTNQEPITVRAYVAPYKGQGYISIERALNDDQMRQQLLAQAHADLEAFQRRYEVLDELDEIFSVITSMLKPSKKKRRAA
jgi:hypothetical protein